ncbi:hypothetical protein MIR68_000085 [Amoeboaphelidium protococcarum]|nr:hypothetical protein MIR68_000085 [Amoeboaphelidium protococcarum]
MGGDLNLKKSWHPATRANLEKVWIAEEKAKKEHQRLDELKKEIQREREAQSLREMQEKSGFVPKDKQKNKQKERLEWMYAVPQIAKEQQEQAAQGDGDNNAAVADDESNDYLTGKKKVSSLLADTSEIAQSSNIQGAADQYSIHAKTGINARNQQRDLENKVREDPMFAIKKQELQYEKEKALKAQRQERSQVRSHPYQARSVGGESSWRGQSNDHHNRSYPRDDSRDQYGHGRYADGRYHDESRHRQRRQIDGNRHEDYSRHFQRDMRERSSSSNARRYHDSEQYSQYREDYHQHNHGNYRREQERGRGNFYQTYRDRDRYDHSNLDRH